MASGVTWLDNGQDDDGWDAVSPESDGESGLLFYEFGGLFLIVIKLVNIMVHKEPPLSIQGLAFMPRERPERETHHGGFAHLYTMQSNSFDESYWCSPHFNYSAWRSEKKSAGSFRRRKHLGPNQWKTSIQRIGDHSLIKLLICISLPKRIIAN